MQPVRQTSPEGVEYRDLNGNGRMDPFEDPRLTVEERVEDLLGRLSLEEKAGLMFHTVIEAGADGTVIEAPGAISKSPTSVRGARTSTSPTSTCTPSTTPGWRPAGTTPCRRSPSRRRTASRSRSRPTRGTRSSRTPGSPSPPRRSRSGPSRSAWPRCATPTPVREFADIARQEYVRRRASGPRCTRRSTSPPSRGGRARRARSARTPTSSPSWAWPTSRVSSRTSLGPDSVACTSKHFPGGGPQKDGEDAHFPYGREQVYPGGRFADHLKPFPPIIEAGTAAIMPYYGMPVGLEVDGEPIEEVGFGFNAPGRHRPAARAARLRRRRASPTGSSSTTTTSATRCCRRGPGASSTSTRTGGWSCILARRRRPVRRRGVRRAPARPRRRRAGSPRRASTSRRGACWP